MRPSTLNHKAPSTPVALYWVGRLWLTLTRWKVEGDVPPVQHAIIIAAPHTSNWDLPHMLAVSWVLRWKISWMGKHTLFRGLGGRMLRAMGGVPVDRRAAGGVVASAAKRLADDAPPLILAVAPSGTRSRRDHWKSGFYWIAKTAKAPIIMTYLDYGQRRVGIGPMLTPGDDLKADMDAIRAFYASMKGRDPAKMSTIALREESGGTQ